MDETNSGNGALRVIPGSHLNGICKTDSINIKKENEVVCNVSHGGVMIMKPLLFHASSRTINNKSRRVIHFECSNCILPADMEWAEKSELPFF